MRRHAIWGVRQDVKHCAAMDRDRKEGRDNPIMKGKPVFVVTQRKGGCV
jgi:hypothetical protein